ncbi:unnamed protein product [Agarophyton chilense]
MAQTSIHEVEAPRLCNIDTALIRTFLRRRDEYEQLIREKNESSQRELSIVSLKSTVSDSVMKTLCKAQLVSRTNSEQLTDDMLKALIERTIVNFVSLRFDEIEHMHIRERTRPFVLQERMIKVLRSEKKNGCHYNHFYDFIRRLVQEAETSEKEGYEEPNHIKDIRKSEVVVGMEIEEDSSCQTNIRKPEEGTELSVPCGIAVDWVSKVITPLCWNKEKCFGQRHRLKDCPNSTKKEKKFYFKRAMRKRYNRKSSKVKIGKGRIDNARILNVEKHCILFKVSFADAIADAVTAKVKLADALTSKGFHGTSIEAVQVGNTKMHDS